MGNADRSPAPPADGGVGRTQMIAAGAFDAGGMRPKIEAAAGFARLGAGRAIIAHLASGPAALRGETGTTIVRDA